ncbi:MAG: choice-of-anchor L domain-containing protein [Bacteroidota bacterium]
MFLPIRQIYISFLIGLMLVMNSVNAQLVVNNSTPYNDPVFLVENILLDAGVTVSNVIFNGSSGIPIDSNANMIGYFNGIASNIGIDAGVILCTGSIFDAPGPNDSGNDGFDNGTPGDPDLYNIVSPYSTFNAAVLEFDFETVTDAISFRYVFASEEYNEYVCSDYNDVFAFLISGPGITGVENIALVPSTSTYVAINTVNNGTIGLQGDSLGCGGQGDPGLNNSTYFVDNETLNGQSVQYDGFTTVLTAQKALTPCETYHIKFAVADVSDGVWDSGVFLEAASFGAVGIQVQVGEIGAPTATVTEGCDPLIFTFSRPGSTDDPLTIYFVITGTATNGVDYDYVVDSIVIPIGQSSVDLLVSAFLDGIPEGIETIIITIPANLTNNTCIDDVESSVTVTIINTNSLSVTASTDPDTIFCPGESAILYANATGGVAPLTYTWDNGAGNSSIVSVSPSSTTTYTVTVTDACETSIVTDQVTVTVIDPPPSMIFSNNMVVEGCSDAVFTISRLGSTVLPLTVYYTISGTATNGSDYTNIPDSVVIPAGQSSVNLVISPILDGIPETDETIIITLETDVVCPTLPNSGTIVIINVDPLTLTVNDDTTICIIGSAMLSAIALAGSGTLSYTWDDGNGTISNQQSLYISPFSTTTYIITVADTCGYVVTDSVTITVNGIGMAGDSKAVEECKDAVFTFYRAEVTGDLTIDYIIGGTAINGVDYLTISDSIIIPDGESSAELVISPEFDSILEGDETVIITIQQSGDYELCPDSSVSAVITDVEPLEVTAMEDVTVCNEYVVLTAEATGGYGPLSYSWISNGITLRDVIVKPVETTVYTVIVTDTCGPRRASDDVIVEIDCEFLFEIPNAFSPNGDGLNDIFNGVGKGIKEYEMFIYNRWGDEIFETSDKHQGWDGKGNGGKDVAQQEVYVYIIKIKDYLDQPHNFIGRVTLVR